MLLPRTVVIKQKIDVVEQALHRLSREAKAKRNQADVKYYDLLASFLGEAMALLDIEDRFVDTGSQSFGDEEVTKP